MMANNVDLDETARDESSHLGLYCLQNYMLWSAGLKELNLPALYLMFPILKLHQGCVQ